MKIFIKNSVAKQAFDIGDELAAKQAITLYDLYNKDFSLSALQGVLLALQGITTKKVEAALATHSICLLAESKACQENHALKNQILFIIAKFAVQIWSQEELKQLSNMLGIGVWWCYKYNIYNKALKK